jgi:hypothetical protein
MPHYVNIALGAVLELAGCCLLVGGNKRVKKGFFVCEGLGKQKAFFYWLVAWGKQLPRAWGKTAGAWAERWTGGMKKRLRSKPILISLFV